jgi:MGT family glycosyltransferase
VARFVFLTWNGGGNQPPAIGIAQELSKRGHQIVFAGYAAQEPYFTTRGLSFVLLERSQQAWDQAPAENPVVQLVDGVLVCQAHLDEVPEIFHRERADVLVVDCMMFAATLACDLARLPAAVLVHSAPGALLHPDRTLTQRALQPLNSARAATGRPMVERLWEHWAGMEVLCTSITALDPLREQMPAEFAFVGPIFETVASSGWRSPWPSDDERPLILVSFSTYVGSPPQTSRIERTLKGLAALPYRVLVTSSTTDVSQIEVPENAVIVRQAPHGEILPETAAIVAHGGHGTITAALSHGVPLVCLPNARIADQVPLAAQVEELGAGRALDGDLATAEEIGAAVVDVLANPTYRASARELAEIISTTTGAIAAASRLGRFAAERRR